jgi:conjugal transfer ATP-binding protein TraC
LFKLRDFFVQNRTTFKDGMFPFHTHIPYEHYNEQHDVYSYENYLGWVAELSPYMGINETIQKDLQALLEDILPEGSSFQVLLISDPCTQALFSDWENGLRYHLPLLETLGKKRLDFLSPWPKTRNFRCILSITLPGSIESLGTIRVIQRIKDHLKKTMEGQIWSLTPDLFIPFMDQLYNLKPSNQSSNKEWTEKELLSAQIMSRETSMTVNPHEIELCDGDIKLRTYTVMNFPKEWALYGMGSLIGDLYNEWLQIPCPFILHYGGYMLPQEKSQDALMQKMKLTEHQGRSGHLLKLIPKLDQEVIDARYARNQLYGGEKLLWTQFSVGIWDKSEQIDRADAVLKSLFRSKYFGIEENTYLHACQYRSWMPMIWNQEYVHEMRRFGLLKTTLSGEATHLLPVMAEWKGTPTKGMPLLGRRGQLFFWHAFDNRCGNYNVIVVGRSGSGKSVFMQELLVSTLRLGGRVFVLDVGRSFEKTCLLLEGQFIAFEKNTNLCLNPFSTIPLHDEEIRNDMFAMMKSLLAMMAAPTANTSDYENAWLEKAIIATWHNKQQKATISDVSDWLLQQKDENAKRLGTMLTPFTKNGIYARYFEGENNVDFTNPMVVIELEELKEKKDLQGVVLQMFIMTISSQMFLGDRKTPFHICIDEAWDLLRGSQTGPFIETLARRLRKYNGSLVIGTQSIEDFYQTQGAMAAYENSDWMCLLSQKPSSIDRLKENKRLTMDSSLEASLKSLRMRAGEYSEVLIYNTQEGYAIGQLCLDSFSALLYSTKASDYEQVKTLRDKGLSIADALDTVLSMTG